MRSLLLVLAAAAGCGKSQAPPAAQLVPVLPDAIATRLGTIGLAIAVDFHGVDVPTLFGGQPAKLPCVHDLVIGVRDAVVTVGDGGWQGIVDGLPEAPARACLAQLALPVRAGTGPFGGIEVDVHGTTLAVYWHGDVATVAQSGVIVRSGEPPLAMIDVIEKVPHGVKAWLAVTGLPDFKIERAVGWLDVQPAAWVITVNADGATPTAAKDWIDTLVRGFTVALAGRGITVDGSWFAITQAPPSAKLVATIPIGAFGSGSD